MAQAEQKEPAGMQLEELGMEQAQLMARLVAVNGELAVRYRSIAESAGEVEGVAEQVRILGEAADHLESLNAQLTKELAPLAGGEAG